MSLDELRASGVPAELLGLILGVSTFSLSHWRLGERRPSASARRLIWLVHRLWMGDAPRTLDDWFLWLPPKSQSERDAEADRVATTRGMDGDGI